MPDHPEHPEHDDADVAETEQVQLADVQDDAPSEGDASDQDSAPTEIIDAQDIADTQETRVEDLPKPRKPRAKPARKPAQSLFAEHVEEPEPSEPGAVDADASELVGVTARQDVDASELVGVTARQDADASELVGVTARQEFDASELVGVTARQEFDASEPASDAAPAESLPPMDATEQMSLEDLPPDEEVQPEDLGTLPPPAPEETNEEFITRMVPVVEGLIFASDHPLPMKEMIGILTEEGETKAEAELLTQSIERVKAKYASGAGLQLVEVAGGYAFRTASVAARYLKRAHQEKPFKMGRAALETLAIIAYRQPVTKAQIDELRGVDSSGALKALLDKNLVRVLGKAEEVGRPLLYGTTKAFLEAFNLKVLADLPTLREYQELTAENQAKVDQVAPIQALGRIRDLAKPGDRIVSAEVEQEGSDAMRELDRAVGAATNTGRNAEVVLAAGGKLPPGMDLEKMSRPPPTTGSEDGEEGAPAAEPAGEEDEPDDQPAPSSDADEDPGREEAE